MGVKMVLSGEGSDEILGGYLYFGHAPNAEEFHKAIFHSILFPFLDIYFQHGDVGNR
jgi:asparagine synthase (glutamine-hydrolysing)